MLNELSDLSFFNSATIGLLTHERDTIIIPAWHFTTYLTPLARRVCQVWSAKMWSVFDECFWTSYGPQVSVKMNHDNNQLPELHQQMQNAQKQLVCVHRWFKCLNASRNQVSFLPWYCFLPQACTNLVIYVFKCISNANKLPNKSPFVEKDS